MFLTVDPGVNEAGFALFAERDWHSGRPAMPLKAFCVAARRDLDAWHERVSNIMTQLEARIAGETVNRVWCEFPVLFSGAVGHAAARRGDLTHLAASVGFIAEWARQRSAVFEEVPVNKWIGQLPKDVMQERVRKVLLAHHPALKVSEILGSPSHHWDATGVGLYAQGFFG